LDIGALDTIANEEVSYVDGYLVEICALIQVGLNEEQRFR